MSQVTGEKRTAPAPCKASQIGMVVRNARSSAEYFSGLYNIKPWYHAEFVEKKIFYRGKEIELDAEILIGFSGGVEIELIQMNNDEENIYSDILGKQDGGIHHIGFFISGYDRKLAEMKAMGVEPLQWGTLKTKGGAVTRFTYFDTIKTCGTVTEYIETKFIGVCVPHNRFMMKISTLTGDATRVGI
jgi:methylmalonyl-CoA/ethylmalonyl-CoA epimerase